MVETWMKYLVVCDMLVWGVAHATNDANLAMGNIHGHKELASSFKSY